jgi:exodeoxyribonuclease III
MRIATYNCNGLRTRMGAMFNWLDQRKPNILAVQETKVPDDKFPQREFEVMGYETAFVGQKTYNGVCIVSPHVIDVVSTVLPGWDQPDTRFMHARVQGVNVINSYVPQGRTLVHEQFQNKLAYFNAVRAYLETLDPTSPIAWVGDLNVAFRPEDVYAEMRKDGPAYCDTVRQALADTASWGLYDIWLKHNTGGDQYSCWDFRIKNALQNKKGWRLDYILVSDVLANACTACWIDEAARALPKPSDHTYVVADFGDIS